jgi:hypothetical protein
VQHGDDLLFFGVDAGHDSERVEDVWFSVSPLLAGVGLSSNLERGIEEGGGHCRRVIIHPEICASSGPRNAFRPRASMVAG